MLMIPKVMFMKFHDFQVKCFYMKSPQLKPRCIVEVHSMQIYDPYS